jgi:solute:Na+ symporter, SSS family
MLTYLAVPEAPALRLELSARDLLLLGIFFVWVLGIGFALKRVVSSSLDFFLSGRSLPAWVTGLAFISANLGALEILGFAASGAQYGTNQLHYYWIGAIPAMVFLGIVMMPFYYGSKVRSTPEYLRLRYDKKAHLINAVTFVAGSLLIAGVNLFALASVLRALLGVPLPLAVVLSALFVLSYILLGGLTSAMYTEVLQFSSCSRASSLCSSSRSGRSVESVGCGLGSPPGRSPRGTWNRGAAWESAVRTRSGISSASS